MGWCITRITIFMAAFLFGVIATGRVDANRGDGEALGKQLVVGCAGGKVIVTSIQSGGAVQLQCRSNDMFVVRESEVAPEKIPARVYHLGPVATIQSALSH